MNPLLSIIAILISMGVVFSLIHLLSAWMNVSDPIALLLFAAPITGYISYCTHETRATAIRSALVIYCSFGSVVLASVGLVYRIGQEYPPAILTTVGSETVVRNAG